MSVFFRPMRAMQRVTGITAIAMPMTISAMGAVAHFGLGARSAPIILPINIISGMTQPAIAVTPSSI